MIMHFYQQFYVIAVIQGDSSIVTIRVALESNFDFSKLKNNFTKHEGHVKNIITKQLTNF